jgi:HTH-type transcriptional regulator/antitoxin HipB
MHAAPRTHPLATAPQLGQLLKAARKRRNFTQAAVASRIGLSQNRLSYLELHPDEISVKQLLAWCAIVGLELWIGDRDLGVATAREADW